MDWIMLHAGKVLRGTMAGEPLAYQAIFIRLLCLANESGYRDGRLMFPPDKPMSRQYISTSISVDEPLLNEAIEYFKKERTQDPNSPHYGKSRIQELDNGILYISNFKEYNTAKPSRRDVLSYLGDASGCQRNKALRRGK